MSVLDPYTTLKLISNTLLSYAEQIHVVPCIIYRNKFKIMKAYIVEVKKFSEDYLNDAFAETINVSERVYLDRDTAYKEVQECQESFNDMYFVSVREVELIK